MRLLLINPDIPARVSQSILARAQRSAPAGMQLEVATAPFGVACIETRREALIGAGAARPGGRAAGGRRRHLATPQPRRLP